MPCLDCLKMRRGQGGALIGGTATLNDTGPVAICGDSLEVARVLYVAVTNKTGTAIALPDSFSLVFEKPACLQPNEWTQCEWPSFRFDYLCAAPILFRLYSTPLGGGYGFVAPVSTVPFVWQAIGLVIDFGMGTADFTITDVP